MNMPTEKRMGGCLQGLVRLDRFLYWLRLRRAVRKWNSDIPLILAMADGVENGLFKWGQLVWQEVWMYAKLGNAVQPDEFEQLCRRRGFDPMMREYLAVMVRHIGLGRFLKANGKVSDAPDSAAPNRK